MVQVVGSGAARILRRVRRLLFWESATDDSYAIFIGSLDTPTGLRLASHIFVDDKSDYYEIDDGLPQFAGYDRPVGTASD